MNIIRDEDFEEAISRLGSDFGLINKKKKYGNKNVK
jgi:hypothetical protein